MQTLAILAMIVMIIGAMLLIALVVGIILFVTGVIGSGISRKKAKKAESAPQSVDVSSTGDNYTPTEHKKSSIMIALGLSLAIPGVLVLTVILAAHIGGEIETAVYKDNCLGSVVRSDNFERAKFLLEQGVDPDSNFYDSRSGNYGNEYIDDIRYGSPMMYAIDNGNYDMVKLLLDYGADPNLRSMHVHTPICEAINYKQYDILQLLIDRGGDVNGIVSDSRDHPFIIAAVENRDVQAVEIMLRNGADPNAKNLCGYSAWHLVAESGERNSEECRKIRQLLEDYGAVQE